ncbi:MAG: pseudouridine synthase, partial [Oscillospiraceae bacterium]|nr:pseudouridine synthase [Oscillospiraceae bacterium]
MPKAYSFTVKEEESGLRLDKFLSQQGIDLTRSLAEKYIEEGCVTRGGKPLLKSFRVTADEQIDALIPDPQKLDVLPEAIPLDIVYEDSSLLVVNKPKGMVVHPAPGHYTGTLVNALLAHCGDSLSGINGVIRPGIVHRIDKDTSGLLMVAKTNKAHIGLAAQIKDHSFTRIYEAVV